MAETVNYLTKLSPDECLRRLESQAVRHTVFQQFRAYPKGTIFRHLRGRSFVLRASLGGNLMNSFEPVFRGSLEAHPEGTLIRGEFGTHRGTRAFTVVFTVFCAVLLAGFGAVVIQNILTGRASAESTPYLGVAIGVALLISVWALRRWGTQLGAGQKAALENFLHSKLEAHQKADRDSVSYKGFEILPASRKLPGQDRWRVEFIATKYNEKGETKLQKTIVAENFFKTKKKADIWAIRIAKMMIDGELPDKILDA